LLGHPLLASMLSALPLLTERDLPLPLDSAAWAEGDWSVAGDLFLWQLAPDPLRLLFLGRLPVIWLTLLLGSVALRWGRQWAGRAAGLAVMTLLLLDPNVIAHGRLVTGDIPLTFFFVVALYGFWRFAQTSGSGRPGWPGLAVAGLGLGLAAASKFNAAVAVPLLVVQALTLSLHRRTLRPVAALLPLFLMAGFVVAAVYRFQLWHGFLPGGSFWDDLLWQQRYVQKSHNVFLFGRVSGESWWYYFPVAYLLKTPLPTLLLLGAALFAFVRRLQRRQATGSLGLFLLLPPAIYFLASSAAALNIGYRYLLPALPFVALFIAVSLGQRRLRQAQVRAVLVALIAVLGVRSVHVWPDFVSFFNLAAGGDGWRLLADSNVDWGQDLPALARWQEDAAGEQTLYLSYFGTAHPSAYGIRFRSLPTWDPGPEQEPRATQTFNPADPAPGLYAISVNNLHGVVLEAGRDTFSWFRDREAKATLGGSIRVYEVSARAEPVNLALSGLRPATLAAPLHAALRTNDVRVRWFDHDTSFVWPVGGGWFAVPASAQPSAALVSSWPESPEVAAEEQQLYHIAADDLPSWLQPPAGDGPLRFRGAQLLAVDEQEIALLTAWEVSTPSERPLQLFVHALDSDSNRLAGQWDGLDVPARYWQPGDVFVQAHELSLAGPAVDLQLVTGVYDAATLTRYSEHVIVVK
jgi:hypothetical protein